MSYYLYLLLTNSGWSWEHATCDLPALSRIPVKLWRKMLLSSWISLISSHSYTDSLTHLLFQLLSSVLFFRTRCTVLVDHRNCFSKSPRYLTILYPNTTRRHVNLDLSKTGLTSFHQSLSDWKDIRLAEIVPYPLQLQVHLLQGWNETAGLF